MPRIDFSRPWDRELELETAQGNHVSNSQSNEPVPAPTILGFETRWRHRFPHIVERSKRSTGSYNCHGMVFASRRTQIYDPEQLRLILRDDGYNQIPDAEVLPGDIALYVHESGAIDHSAVVVELPPEDSLLKIPKVFSKWGTWVEVIHWANECPWAQEAGTSIQYFRVV